MPTMELRGGKTCGERPVTLVCPQSALAARGPIACLRDRNKKREGAVASWRPSIFARHAAQLTKPFSRAPGAPTYSLNSSTQRPSLRLLKRCRSPFDHALPVRAEQIRGLEHEQPVVLITGGPTGICASARSATALKSRMTGERKCRSLKRI